MGLYKHLDMGENLTKEGKQRKQSKVVVLFFFLKKGKMVKPRKEETGKVNPGKALLY